MSKIQPFPKRFEKESSTKICNEIAKTWISGQNSCTMIISKKIAEEYELTEPSHVILERRPEGILIRKLEL